MVINSLNAINRSIKKNITLSLLSLLAVSLLILNVIYYNNVTTVNQQNKVEIASNLDLLKSNLSEKISIIASSSAFVDYLRSGSVSQKSLQSDFIYDLKSLKLKDIRGMKIVSTSGDTIFSDGVTTSHFVDLPLCYLDRGLDSMLGDCSHHLIIYFNMNEIIKSLKKVNDNLIDCKNCTPIDFLSSRKFGSFNVANASKMPLLFEIRKSQNFNILTLNVFFFLFMVILATWTWRRTNSILDKYISDPIKTITNKLKSGAELIKNDEINELAYLIDQIQGREDKLKLAKENENLVAVGQMASQVAHDILSPLSALNIIVRQTADIPEKQRIMIHNASQQINDIANNLLTQYRDIPEDKLILNNEFNVIKSTKLSTLLDTIVTEKKAQYNCLPIRIDYHIAANAQNISVNIASTNFKRVISNIINNAIEAIAGAGNISVDLSANLELAIIHISDTGMGMPPTLIRRILNGESVTYKQGGSGIGLASSYKFILTWGGNLDIASQPNVGTIISISLPISKRINACENPDLILIDDNKVFTDSWQFAALHKKKKIVVFNNIDDAQREIINFDRDTPIYIDSDLGGSIRGEQYAKNLYEQGFEDIYLTTGYKDSSFAPMYWIKEIIGKDSIFN